MGKYNLNEALKAKAAEQSKTASGEAEVKLDDISRVKVLSPARKVFKRFMRNRLAVVGACILIAMFAFAFLGPLFYPYDQDQTFFTYGTQNVNYSQAKVITTYTGYKASESADAPSEVRNMMNSNIKTMLADSKQQMVVVEGGDVYIIGQTADKVYTLSSSDASLVCSAGVNVINVGKYSSLVNKLTYADSAPVDGLEEALASDITKTSTNGKVTVDGIEYTYQRGGVKGEYNVTAVFEGVYYAPGVAPLGAEFETALMSNIEQGDNFVYGGNNYVFAPQGEGIAFDVYRVGGVRVDYVYTRYTLDRYDINTPISEELRVNALLAIGTTQNFTAEGKSYTIANENGQFIIHDDKNAEVAEFTDLSIRRYSGQDTMEYDLKKAIASKIDEMDSKNERTADLVFDLPRQDQETGQQVFDEDGNLVTDPTEMLITRADTGVYNITCDQVIYLIDRFAPPSSAHVLGADGDGFDVLARIMRGGRISLMVGFVVVFLEIILGVILGGLAGYYGKWVDMLVMRLVDIFYCIPSLPILIILGAMMDYQHLSPYPRLLVMMAVLGVLGWAGVARLVRGQILSLREQEFMVAAEATGIKVSTRIFKHLIPNVMPQLIVTATMGVGGVILTESTLSYLGLGVKQPYATWGAMINSVSSQQMIAQYPHIWIPVGLLICLTVIAFNFVGDGLRDAYDPKSKK